MRAQHPPRVLSFKKGTFMKRMNLKVIPMTLALLTASLNLRCSPNGILWAPGMNSETSSQDTQHCQAGIGVSTRPRTIEDVVSLINSLPKPVTVSCFLESLERPLNVTLTNSQISAQPASGSRSPRIFILNDKLYISVVPEGRGTNFMELSYQTSTTTSIKAEIEFPVVGYLPRNKPYASIYNNSGTTCRACHRAEKQVSEIEGTGIFESWAFQPDKETLVDLQNLKTEAKNCNSSIEPERCKIIRALLDPGQVRTQSFPAEMYYNFSTW